MSKTGLVKTTIFSTSLYCPHIFKTFGVLFVQISGLEPELLILRDPTKNFWCAPFVCALSSPRVIGWKGYDLVVRWDASKTYFKEPPWGLKYQEEKEEFIWLNLETFLSKLFLWIGGINSLISYYNLSW